MQRGRKFSDGTGCQDLFEGGGKMDEYAYGGKVVKAYENGGKDDEGDPPKVSTVKRSWTNTLMSLNYAPLAA